MISDLNVQLNGDVAGLTISLTSPSGTTVALGGGRSSLRSYDIILNDEATLSFAEIQRGLDAVSGPARPSASLTSLAGFDGESTQGTWQLNIGSTGTLNSWSLQFNTGVLG